MCIHAIHSVYCDEWFDPNSNLFKIFLKMDLKIEFRKKEKEFTSLFLPLSVLARSASLASLGRFLSFPAARLSFPPCVERLGPAQQGQQSHSAPSPFSSRPSKPNRSPCFLARPSKASHSPTEPLLFLCLWQPAPGLLSRR